MQGPRRDLGPQALFMIGPRRDLGPQALFQNRRFHEVGLCGVGVLGQSEGLGSCGMVMEPLFRQVPAICHAPGPAPTSLARPH